METESVIKVSWAKKIPGSNDFTGGFHQIFKEEPILLKLFQKIVRGKS